MGPPFANMPNSQPQNQTQFNPNMMQMNNPAMNQQTMNQNNMMRRPSQINMQPMIPQQPEMLRNQFYFIDILLTATDLILYQINFMN